MESNYGIMHSNKSELSRPFPVLVDLEAFHDRTEGVKFKAKCQDQPLSAQECLVHKQSHYVN